MLSSRSYQGEYASKLRAMIASRPERPSARASARDSAGAPDWSRSPPRKKLKPIETRGGAAESGAQRVPQWIVLPHHAWIVTDSGIGDLGGSQLKHLGH